MSILVIVLLATIGCFANTDEICFDGVGCFDMGPPWSSPTRAIPPPNISPVTAAFYSRRTNKPYFIQAYPNIDMGGAPYDENLATVIIVHGYLLSGEVSWMTDMKDVYLERVEANVMIIDWSSGSLGDYGQTVSNIRVVARLIAKLLNHLMDEYGLTRNKIHLIGHSLGGQLISYIGKEISGIGRLTALDPAQPLFEGYDKRVRLDMTDAAYVEVVHTDAIPFIPNGGFGTMQPSGSVDFYFNEGGYQPGCSLSQNLPKIANLAELVLYPFELIYDMLTCSHNRSTEYLIEAYNKSSNCQFWGHRPILLNSEKSLANILTLGMLSDLSVPGVKCHTTNCIPFGYETINSPLRGIFFINTNNKPPYCRSSHERDTD